MVVWGSRQLYFNKPLQGFLWPQSGFHGSCHVRILERCSQGGSMWPFYVPLGCYLTLKSGHWAILKKGPQQNCQHFEAFWLNWPSVFSSFWIRCNSVAEKMQKRVGCCVIGWFICEAIDICLGLRVLGCKMPWFSPSFCVTEMFVGMICLVAWVALGDLLRHTTVFPQ